MRLDYCYNLCVCVCVADRHTLATLHNLPAYINKNNLANYIFESARLYCVGLDNERQVLEQHTLATKGFTLCGQNARLNFFYNVRLA